MTLKIKHVDLRPNGVLRFRRKFPKDVQGVLGTAPMQVHIRNRKGAAFHAEYQAILTEFDRLVAEARQRAGGIDTRPATTRWHEALLESDRMVRAVKGLEDDPEWAAREIAKGLAQRGNADPLVVKALLQPDAEPPKATVADGVAMYRSDKITDEKTSIQLDRYIRRLEQALGPLDKIALEDLNATHRRTYRDHLMRAKKADGTLLSHGTRKKEAKIIAAVVAHGLRENGLEGVAPNVFYRLDVGKADELKVNNKMPLPDDLVETVQVHLNERAGVELGLIWRLLRGTGARLNEIVGLHTDDIVLDDKTPHLHIRPNSIRRIKTAGSIRTVPLVGDALVAVKEALEGARDAGPLFARYAHDRGADAVSASLMKTLRQYSSEKKHSVHGLRHRFSDKLRDAGAPQDVRHGFLGHASSAVAENTYGSPEARLREFIKWALLF